jgi:protein-disulfide isomerase-like protein with CxxC motif
MAAPKRKPTMTAEHKAKLAAGRNESRAVARYLEALEAHRPKQGRKRTSESVAKQLAATEAGLKTATGIERLELLQRQRDLRAESERLAEGVDLSALEAEFVKVARSYGERKGITYGTWRDFGVAADVLKRAGIQRTRG